MRRKLPRCRSWNATTTRLSNFDTRDHRVNTFFPFLLNNMCVNYDRRYDDNGITMYAVTFL
jgi:ribosome biogenesis protein Tsr3